MTKDSPHLRHSLQPRATESSRFWRRLSRHKLGVFGVTVFLLFVLMSIFAPLITPDPNAQDLKLRNKPPSTEHILGTDRLGRDVWARVVYGGRVSIAVGVVAVSIYTIIGVTLGGISGYFGGWVDNVIMRFTDVMMCFPTFLLIVTAVAVLSPSIVNVMVIIGVFGWTGMCRLVRGQFLSLRTQDFVTAAQATGVPERRIIFRHILPNAVAPIVVAATIGIAGAILTESGLSFLGLGVQVPTSSWGSILMTSMQLPVLENMLWRWIPPASAISLTILAINFAGDALRDALDPRGLVD